jgi:glycosyltransferase involved in cell wall biosynthesis
MAPKIQISVIITTLNEESALPRCLKSLNDFDEVIVVDSHSTDATQAIAKTHGARVVNFTWNRRYPKKRQWCLDNIRLKHDWVLFIDADEEATPVFCEEIKKLSFDCSGYFVDGLYVVDGQVLRRGFRNRKLCLINRHAMIFPEVNDLDIAGMGEIEGHYQPVFQPQCRIKKIGRLKAPIYHYAFEDKARWQQNHARYADWEAGMIAKKAFPQDPVRVRSILKKLFLNRRLKGYALFFYYFILRGGFLEGRNNLDFSLKKLSYYTNFKT